MKSMTLVVEDDKAVRNLITTTLETQGYALSPRKRGATLSPQRCLTAGCDDLDLGLPDIDGVEIIKKGAVLEQQSYYCSQRPQRGRDKIDALDAGADYYLTKPFSVEELLARIRVALRKMNYDNSPVKIAQCLSTAP